jgi:hypothetical protein
MSPAKENRRRYIRDGCSARNILLADHGVMSDRLIFVRVREKGRRSAAKLLSRDEAHLPVELRRQENDQQINVN